MHGRPLWAQESTPLQEDKEIRRLREEIARLQKEIDQAKQSQMTHSEKIKATESKIAKMQKLIKELNIQLKKSQTKLKANEKSKSIVESDIYSLDQQLKSVHLRISTLQAVAREQAIHRYKHRNQKTWLYFFSANSLRKAFKRVRMLEQVQRYEARLFNELKTERQQHQLEIAELSEQYSKIAKATKSTRTMVEYAKKRKSEIEKERSQLEKEKNISRSEITKSRERIEKHERALKERQASLREIENIISKRIKENETRKSRQPTTTIIPKKDNVEGKAITAGSLSWPLRGEILVPFGISRDPVYNTQIENPGIEVKAEVGAIVRAAADGRVVTTTWMRGFESIIVLEHPENGFTVYSRLGEVNVGIGENVKRGQVLGKVGRPPEGESSKLHFEVWIQRSKKNPLQYLGQ